MAVDDLGVYKHRPRLSRWNAGQYNYGEGNTLAQLLHQDDSRTHTYIPHKKLSPSCPSGTT